MRRRGVGLEDYFFASCCAWLWPLRVAPRFAGAREFEIWEIRSSKQSARNTQKTGKIQSRRTRDDSAEPKEVASKEPAKPKVRTITAFLKLNRETYEQQIAETLISCIRRRRIWRRLGTKFRHCGLRRSRFRNIHERFDRGRGYKFLRQARSAGGRRRDFRFRWGRRCSMWATIRSGGIIGECAGARGEYEWQRGDRGRRWNSLGRDWSAAG